MPHKAWSAKRERQYLDIKESLLEHGKTEPVAEEIAARVVKKERAQHGESVTASASSINDMPAGRRGGLHSDQEPGRSNAAPASQRGKTTWPEGPLCYAQGAA